MKKRRVGWALDGGMIASEAGGVVWWSYLGDLAKGRRVGARAQHRDDLHHPRRPALWVGDHKHLSRGVVGVSAGFGTGSKTGAHTAVRVLTSEGAGTNLRLLSTLSSECISLLRVTMSSSASSFFRVDSASRASFSAINRSSTSRSRRWSM